MSDNCKPSFDQVRGFVDGFLASGQNREAAAKRHSFEVSITDGQTVVVLKPNPVFFDVLDDDVKRDNMRLDVTRLKEAFFNADYGAVEVKLDTSDLEGLSL